MWFNDREVAAAGGHEAFRTLNSVEFGHLGLNIDATRFVVLNSNHFF